MDGCCRRPWDELRRGLTPGLRGQVAQMAHFSIHCDPEPADDAPAYRGKRFLDCGSFGRLREQAARRFHEPPAPIHNQRTNHLMIFQVGVDELRCVHVILARPQRQTIGGLPRRT